MTVRLELLVVTMLPLSVLLVVGAWLNDVDGVTELLVVGDCVPDWPCEAVGVPLDDCVDEDVPDAVRVCDSEDDTDADALSELELD